MERWRDRVALVTGASAGIGAAVATMLGESGMRVAVCARRLDRLQALGDDMLALPCDVRDEAQILATCDAVRSEWGGIDILVNNAQSMDAPLTTGATANWRELLEVNVLALSVFTREAVADMHRRGVSGHVVHISSLSAHRVPPGNGGMYAATKHAVRALTEGLRHELHAAGSDVRVTAISPGFVETEFAEVATGSRERAAEVYARYPCLQSDDVVAAVRYTLSQPPHVQVHDVLLRPARQPT